MLTFNSLLLDCFMRFPRKNQVKVRKMPHFWRKLIRHFKRFVFIVKNPDTVWEFVWRRKVIKRKGKSSLWRSRTNFCYRLECYWSYGVRLDHRFQRNTTHDIWTKMVQHLRIHYSTKGVHGKWHHFRGHWQREH